MRLGKGIGNGLINRVGFWAHGKGEVDGGCFSARVGGGVAIVARVSLPTRLDWTPGSRREGVTTTSSPDRLEALHSQAWYKIFSQKETDQR